LRSTRTRTLGFLALDDSDRFLADPLTGLYLAGIGDVAREAGYSVLVHSAHLTPDGADLLRPIHEQRVDAVCVMLSGRVADRERVVRFLAATGIAVALFDETGLTTGEGAVVVAADQYGGAQALVDHLVERGHRDIGFIAARTPWAVVEQRYQGYLDAHTRHGRSPLRNGALFEAGWKPPGAAPMVDRLLARRRPPTAIMCGSDLLALGAIRHLIDRGLSVPGDVAVCGFDDFDVAAQSNPALTTVTVPAWQMGSSAARFLIRALEGGSLPSHPVVLPTALQRRESA
jgi:DNA-binding LacI/PurR family transcriptional regulator